MGKEAGAASLRLGKSFFVFLCFFPAGEFTSCIIINIVNREIMFTNACSKLFSLCVRVLFCFTGLLSSVSGPVWLVVL